VIAKTRKDIFEELISGLNSKGVTYPYAKERK
jgi:hypothetical protein